jgi:hypothetical protein
MSRLGVLPAWRVCVSLVVDIREPVCRVTARSAFGFERLGAALNAWALGPRAQLDGV